ncbi:MAG: hypothetical protein ABI813_04730 [Bacteroidota bacterium]
MKRRHRRVLFNLFAFSLLGAALYLNMFKVSDANPLNTRIIVQTVVKPAEKNAISVKRATKAVLPN